MQAQDASPKEDLTARKQPIRYLVQDIGGDFDDSKAGLPQNVYSGDFPQGNLKGSDYPRQKTVPYKDFASQRKLKPVRKAHTKLSNSKKYGSNDSDAGVYLEDQTPGYAALPKDASLRRGL